MYSGMFTSCWIGLEWLSPSSCFSGVHKPLDNSTRTLQQDILMYNNYVAYYTGT